MLSSHLTFRPQLLVQRDLVGAEDRPGAERVALVSDRLWRNRFNGDSSILGRTLRLNAVDHVIIGVAPSGAEIATRPFQLVTGRVWRGTAFGGARGRTDTPRIVDWYMKGLIQIDPMITHVMPLERINDAFHLMEEGKSIRSVVVY